MRCTLDVLLALWDAVDSDMKMQIGKDPLTSLEGHYFGAAGFGGAGAAVVGVKYSAKGLRYFSRMG